MALVLCKKCRIVFWYLRKISKTGKIKFYCESLFGKIEVSRPKYCCPTCKSELCEFETLLPDYVIDEKDGTRKLREGTIW